TMSQIKKTRTLIKMFSLNHYIYDVSIFCLRSRHPNRRSHQCTFLNLFYVKITLFNKDKMFEKMLKIKDFHPLLRCSNTTHSTCLEWAKKMSHPTGIPLAEAHISETVAWIGYFSLIWCLLLRYNPSNCKQ
ncbi:hypothetical protein, partial [Streptococcus alactolyticus]|uniref:hypothetical protein n=1 Tax=Streptococcus alactolyticus TaxID=29389 RepID=UPI003D01CB16